MEIYLPGCPVFEDAAPPELQCRFLGKVYYCAGLRRPSSDSQRLFPRAEDQKKIEVRNALLEIFHNPQLQELQIAELPDDYAEHVKLMRSSHPWLTEGDWQQGLRKWPQVLAAVNGDLAPLQRAPVDCDLKIPGSNLAPNLVYLYLVIGGLQNEKP